MRISERHTISNEEQNREETSVEQVERAKNPTIERENERRKFELRSNADTYYCHYYGRQIDEYA